MAVEFCSVPAALGDKVAAVVARCCEVPLRPGHGKRIAAAFANEAEADLREAFGRGLTHFLGLTACGGLALAPADDELVDASELLRAIDDAAKGCKVAARRAAVLAAAGACELPPDPPAQRPVVLARARHHARKQFPRRK